MLPAPGSLVPRYHRVNLRSMRSDPFESSWFATVLAWVIVGLLFARLLYLAWTVGRPLFSKPRRSRVLLLWLILCALWFSPALYLIWLGTLLLDYGAETLLSIFSSPFHFVALFVCAWVLSLLALLVLMPLALGLKLGWPKNGLASPIRKLAAAGLVPAAGLAGLLLFRMVLPLAAVPVSALLEPEALIRASNGPAWFVYRLVGFLRFDPALFPRWLKEIHGNALECYRGHVAWLYLLPSEEEKYLRRSRPDIFQRDVHVVAGASRPAPRKGPFSYETTTLLQQAFVTDLKEIVLLSCETRGQQNGCTPLQVGSEYAARREGLHLLVKNVELLQDQEIPMVPALPEQALQSLSPDEREIMRAFREARTASFSDVGNPLLPDGTPVLRYKVLDARTDVESWNPRGRPEDMPEAAPVIPAPKWLGLVDLQVGRFPGGFSQDGCPYQLGEGMRDGVGFPSWSKPSHSG